MTDTTYSMITPRPSPLAGHCILCGSHDTRTFRPSPAGDVVRCRRCGLVFRKRIPSDSHLMFDPSIECATDFTDSFTVSSCSVLDTMFRAVHTHKPSKGAMLDIGCGLGRVIKTAKSHGWSVSGLEVSPSCARTCNDSGLDVFCGDLDNYISQKQPQPFDAIAMVEICEFLPDPIAELHRASTILRDDGIIFFRVLNSDFHRAVSKITKFLSRLIPSLRDPSVFHWFAFNPSTFAHSLRAAGLTPIAIIPSPSHKGDPYGFTKNTLSKNLANILLHTFDLISRAVFAISARRIMISTAFIVIAKKHG